MDDPAPSTGPSAVRRVGWVLLGVVVAVAAAQLVGALREAPPVPEPEPFADEGPSRPTKGTPAPDAPPSTFEGSPDWPAPPASAALLGGRAPQAPTRPLVNVLLIVLDDVGQDMIGAYGVHPEPAATPTIDALAARGVTFDHAIANPVCSPTRATLLTGRYAWRYGVGNAIPPKPGWALPDHERLLPRALREATDGAYTSVVVGKWHLATPNRGGWEHPLHVGFDHHDGTMGNLLGFAEDGLPQTYFHWTHVRDGHHAPRDGYITSATVDDALRWVDEIDEPWFLYMPLHSAHYPMHAPPPELYDGELPTLPTEDDLYRAMLEVTDREIGRLLEGLGPALDDTLVIVLGDNGSAPVAVRPPWPKNQAKGALLRGGVRVPFVVAGPGVAEGQRTDALINTSDVYATLVDWLGLDEPHPEDSVSFAPVLRDPGRAGARSYAYAERFNPNGRPPWSQHLAMIRDARFKLITLNGRVEEMYDLHADPMETRNLFDGPGTPEHRAALKRLRFVMPEGAGLVTRPSAEALIASGIEPPEPL